MKGYEEVNLLTSKFPELLILRKFDRLSTRILLRQQAELLYLEQELNDFLSEDEKRYPDINACFCKLKQSGGEERTLLHLEKYNNVEKKLKIYR